MLKGKLLGVGLLLVLAAGAVAHIPRTRIYSTPDVPPNDALRRLNLDKAWVRYVPMEGRGDGFVSIQFDGHDLLALTRSGLVARIDAEDGTLLWRQRVGRRYAPSTELAFNRRTVFAITGTDLYALDRATGAVLWQYRLGGGASARPVADEKQIFIPTATGRLFAYRLPNTDDPNEVAEGLRPAENWGKLTAIRLENPLLLSASNVLAASPTGECHVYEKSRPEGGGTSLVDRFSVTGGVHAIPGEYADAAFIGTDAGEVMAYHIESNRLLWRTPVGRRVTRRVVALGEDVYVSTQGGGLARLSRADLTEKRKDEVVVVAEAGAVLWRNREADRFLAAGPKFVYATDSSNRLLVLDRRRGKVLARLDTRLFWFPVLNTHTDRLYLAANDGLIVCLHDRDQPVAFNQRKQEEEANPLRQKLKERFPEARMKPSSLRDILAVVQKRVPGLVFFIDEPLFKEAGVPDVGTRLLKLPPVDKRSVEEVVLDLLAPMRGTLDVRDDAIYVVPQGRRRR